MRPHGPPLNAQLILVYELSSRFERRSRSEKPSTSQTSKDDSLCAYYTVGRVFRNALPPGVRITHLRKGGWAKQEVKQTTTTARDENNFKCLCKHAAAATQLSGGRAVERFSESCPAVWAGPYSAHPSSRSLVALPVSPLMMMMAAVWVTFIRCLS